jgi:hypothetical protein
MTGFGIKPAIAAIDFAISTTLSFCVAFESSSYYVEGTKKITYIYIWTYIYYFIKILQIIT